MTTINNQEDFLRALSENPEWRAAVRAQILGDEQLQFPSEFNAFVERMDFFIEEQRQTNANVASIVEGQRQLNSEMRASVDEMKIINRGQLEVSERLARNLDRITRDAGFFRGWFSRLNATDCAPVIAWEMGMEFVRTLSRAELVDMAHQGIRKGMDRDSLRSFVNADVIIEATQADATTCYIAVEAYYTADHRDADRALRNADFLTRFTGIPARPCIVSVRNDRELSPDVLQGNIFWYPIPDQFWELE